MTDMTQPILDAMIALIKAQGFKTVLPYSVDNINKIGNNTPAVLVRIGTGGGEQSASVYQSQLSVDCIVYDKSIYDRVTSIIANVNKVKTAILDSVSISETACNIPSYTVDYGSDGIANDMTTAGTSAQVTIAVITFQINYQEKYNG